MPLLLIRPPPWCRTFSDRYVTIPPSFPSRNSRPRILASLLSLLLHFLQNIVNGLGDCFGLFLMHAMARTGNDAELRVLRPVGQKLALRLDHLAGGG